MKIYIDLFFLFNIIMDAIVITSVSILLRRKTSIPRIIISSLLGGISSLLLLTSINKIVIELISVFIMVLIAFKYVSIRYTIKNILYMYILSILLGGLIYLFNIRVTTNPLIIYLIMIIISVEVMFLYIKEMKKMKNNYNNYYNVDIWFKDGHVLSLVGFMDTGNNLYDPYNKRPIILVSNKYKNDNGIILVPYYTASGEGILECVRTMKVTLNGSECKMDILVGFSNSPKLIEGIDVILHKDIVKG